MKKTLITLLVLTFVLSTAAVAFAKDATAVVPVGDWSYQAVDYLIKNGIIDGYGDMASRGDKSMTRQQMAAIVYKAMQNEGKANIAQKALIDKLAAEYALEINNINTNDNSANQAAKNLSALKISGSFFEKYVIKDEPLANKDSSGGKWQVRINMSTDIDPNTTVHLRLADPAPTSSMFHDTKTNSDGAYETSSSLNNSLTADRFYGITKIGVTAITVGRQPLYLDPEDAFVDSPFFSFDGVMADTKWNGLDFNLKRGRFYTNITDYANESTSLATKTLNGFGRADTDFASSDIDAAQVASRIGKFSWDLGWAKFTNNTNSLSVSDKTLMNYLYGNAYYDLTDKLTVGTMVSKNTMAYLANSAGHFHLFTLSYGDKSLKAAGKQNFSIWYYKADKAAINSQFSSIDAPDWYADGWSDLYYQYSYAISKSMLTKLVYSKVIDTTNTVYNYNSWKLWIYYYF